MSSSTRSSGPSSRPSTERTTSLRDRHIILNQGEPGTDHQPQQPTAAQGNRPETSATSPQQPITRRLLRPASELEPYKAECIEWDVVFTEKRRELRALNKRDKAWSSHVQDSDESENQYDSDDYSDRATMEAHRFARRHFWYKQKAAAEVEARKNRAVHAAQVQRERGKVSRVTDVLLRDDIDGASAIVDGPPARPPRWFRSLSQERRAEEEERLKVEQDADLKKED